MAPGAGDAVVYPQGHSFTDRRYITPTCWEYRLLMAPGYVSLQAPFPPKGPAPLKSIPHYRRQPISSDGAVKDGGL